MLIPKFKIRCSQIGEIMSEPRSKAAKEAGELSETAKTYCENWLKEKIYNRKKEIKSKYLDKGNICEGESIEMINNFFGEFYEKNTKHFENDFITGTPDIIGADLIIDIKNSYDFSTFPLFETEPNKDYWYQLHGYMWLCEKDNAKLIYTLCDLPEELIQKETLAYCRSKGIDYNEEDEMYIRGQFTYFDIPISKKIKTFDFSLEFSVMEKIKLQVEKCQNYINQLITKIC